MKKKVLLMGKSGSGKTSMRSIIFADYLARDTTRLSPTIDVEYSSVQFLGNLHLHLWDCGGQDDFFKSYLENMRDKIFTSVELLVYVFDVESEVLEFDMQQFSQIAQALDQHSPDAKIFALIHKMDLVGEEQRESVFAARSDQICGLCSSMKVTVECFQTSIWDETLYRAWSKIVYSLVPNTKILEDHLQEFCRICAADEIVLFESTTFLVIAYCEEKRGAHSDVHRFEKISNIIKQFKLSCRKCAQAQFDGMSVQNSNYTAFFNLFTANTCIMIIVSDPSVQQAAIQLNINSARAHFERLIPHSAS